MRKVHKKGKERFWKKVGKTQLALYKTKAAKQFVEGDRIITFEKLLSSLEKTIPF